jgi:hypothetical protein
VSHRTTISLMLCTALLFFSASEGLAANKILQTSQPKKVSGIGLTKAECEGLGGIVSVSPQCPSLQQCYTTNSDGVIHSKCLSVEKAK